MQPNLCDILLFVNEMLHEHFASKLQTNNEIQCNSTLFHLNAKKNFVLQTDCMMKQNTTHTHTLFSMFCSGEKKSLQKQNLLSTNMFDDEINAKQLFHEY